MKSKFQGTYYKHQKGNRTLCFVVGSCGKETFVQAITNQGVYHTTQGVIRTTNGLQVSTPNIHGSVTYGHLTPLDTPIMGPFAHLPMECAHWVESMGHSIDGGFWVDGDYWDFTGGRGYIEGDKGRSFPQRYTWLQCNDFPQNTSLMLAIATIPLGFVGFMGCICVVHHQGQAYRLASYRGVRICRIRPNHITLTQGALRLEISLEPGTSQVLKSPHQGVMGGLIHESNDTPLYVQLWNHHALVVEGYSLHASFEWQM